MVSELKHKLFAVLNLIKGIVPCIGSDLGDIILLKFKGKCYKLEIRELNRNFILSDKLLEAYELVMKENEE